MRKIKKLLSFIVIFSVLCTTMMVSHAADESKTATIYLNDTAANYTGTTIKKVTMGNQKDVVFLTNRDGVKCWQLKCSNNNNAFVAVDLSDGFLGGIDDGTYVEIAVDYFDEGLGLFCLEYDSRDKTDKETDAVYLEDTKKWKTHVFKIDDGYFDTRHWNGQTDFAICARSDRISTARGDVCISKIEVTKYSKLKPVQCIEAKSDELGNIFANGEEKKFNLKFKNFSQAEQNVKVKYSAFDDYNSLVWSDEDEVNLKSLQSEEKQIVIDAKRYCLYTLKIEVIGENYVQTKEIPFSFINNITDGTKNDYAGFCTKLALVGYDPDEFLQIIDKSGAGFVRNSIQWAVVDNLKTGPGSFFLTDQITLMLKTMSKYNIGLQWLVGLGNTKYGMPAAESIPENEKQMQGFEDYLDFVFEELEKYNVKMHSYEIWNEPNIQAFNRNNDGGEPYSMFAQRALKRIREHDDVTPAFMGSVTGLYETSSREFFKEMLDVVPKGTETAVSLHTYNYNAIPELGQTLIIPDYVKMFEDSQGVAPKIYITELGYYSGAGHAADPRVQANYNMRTYVYYKVKGYGHYFSWYNISREGGVDIYSEHQFGHINSHLPLYEVPYAAKEAFVADTAVNKILQNADVESTVYENETDYAYTFLRPKDNKRILTFWTSGDQRIVRFKLNTNKATLYDLFGNPTELESDNGEFTLKLSDEVQYLEGDFTEAEYIENAIEFSDIDFKVSANSNNVIKISGLPENAELNVKASDAVKIGEVNKNSISFTNNGITDVEDVVNVSIIENGKVNGSIDIGVVNEIPFKSSITTNVVGKADVSLWDGTLNITNYNNSKPLDGKVTFLRPAFLAEGLGSIDLPTIPAGCTGEIDFRLPIVKAMDMYNVTYVIETEDGYKETFEQKMDFTCAIQTDKSPEIDGIMSEGEWDDRAKILCDDEWQVSMYAGQNWSGPDDLSAEINLMFDKENLYVFVKVYDDIKGGTAVKDCVWQNDCVQFGVAFAKNQHDAIIGGTFTEISYGDTPEGPVVWRHSAEKNAMPNGNVASAKLGLVRNEEEKYTNYELMIPWSEITADTIDFDNIEKIGFSMVINDNDGPTRKGWIEYAGGIVRAKDPNMFTFMCVAR